MLCYEDRITVNNKVVKEGLALTGKNLFRNKNAQRLFDEFRGRYGLIEYGRLTRNKNVFYFQFANGVVDHYTRAQILKLSKAIDYPDEI